MTEQITIKLNTKKFKPLIDDLNEFGKKHCGSNSEIAAKAIFFTHEYFFEKLEKLDNKTRIETILEKMGEPKDKAILDFIKKYNRFVSE